MHRIAHLSDCHLRPLSDPLVGGVVDADERLARAIDVLTTWDKPCDAWFFGGDLTDLGDADTYARLRAMVEPAASRVGVRVIWGNGNHDERGPFRRVLLSEVVGDDASDEPLNRAYDLGGLRLLHVDSNVPGRPEGLVSEGSLAWLAERLATPSAHGTIVALHHPPVPPVQDAASAWPLLNPDALGAVIAGRDVRLVIGGHFHETSFTTLAGVPVASASSLVYSQDLTVGRTLRGQAAHTGFNLVEVYPGQVVVTAVHLDVGVGVHRAITPGMVGQLNRWPT